jgi:hypothetical protein
VNAETTLHFWLVAVELMALLGFLGYPVVHLVRRWSARALIVPAPVIGFAVVYLTSWWWLRGTGLGLDVGVPVILALGVVAWIPVAVDLARRPPDLREVARAAVVPLVTVVAVAVLFTFHFSSVFRLDHLSSAAGSNIDVAAYSLVAGHLVDDGLSGPGNIVGYDLSDRAEEDAFGATSLVATAAVASGRDTWEVGTAVLFAVIASLALSLTALVRRLWPGAGLVAPGAALVAVGNYLFVYLALQFFLSQLMAVALLGALLIALLAALWAGAWRPVAASAAVVGLCGATLIATYPGMAFLAPLVMLPAVLACAPRDRRRAALRGLGLVIGCGVVAAIVIAPDQLITAIRRARVLSGVEAGWPLPGMLPSDLVGAVADDISGDGASRWIGSAALIAAIAGAAALRWRADRLARFTAIAWAAAWASYAVVFAAEGESYRQWKWITTFLPLLVALAAALIVAAGMDLARHARLRPAVTQAVALGALAGVVALQTGRADPLIRPYLGGAAPGVHVSTDLARLDRDPRLRSLPGVSVNIVDPVEYQLVAAVLRPQRVLPYPPTATLDQPWILERAGQGPAPGREVVRLDATYQIARAVPVPAS